MSQESVESHEAVVPVILREIASHLFEYNYPRLEKCLNVLTLEELWRLPGGNLVSIGNLVMHLNGNVTQYILSALGGEPDLRRRGEEFDSRPNLEGGVLLATIAATLRQAEKVVLGLDESALFRSYRVQGKEQKGMHILVHVVEHLSYHVGQITFWTKHLKSLDTGYYAGWKLDDRNSAK